MPNKTKSIRDRYDFSSVKTAIPIPNLMELPKESYDRFLQMDKLPDERENIGLQAVFNSVFPIEDFKGNCTLEFVEYTVGNWECKCGNLVGIENLKFECKKCGKYLTGDPEHIGHIVCPHCGTRNENKFKRCENCGDPVKLKIKYDVEECIDRGLTYGVPLKVKVRMVIWDTEEGGSKGERTISDIKEQEVYFTDIPLMTPRGTFVVNGTERVVVNQIHKSPGVFFEADFKKKFFLGKIIPYRGSWVEFEIDAKNILYIRIDRKKRFLATIFLKALGYESNEEILNLFYTPVKIVSEGEKFFRYVDESLIGFKMPENIVDPEDPEDVIYKANTKFNRAHIETLKDVGIEKLELTSENLKGAILLNDVIDYETGEIIAEANDFVTTKILAELKRLGVNEFNVAFPEFDPVGPIISNTLRKDVITTHEEALKDFYRKLRPGEPPTAETAAKMFEAMFFDPKRYDFSRVGRLKYNLRFNENVPLDKGLLSKEDFIKVIDYLVKIPQGYGKPDDIDHLGNRRVRSVGELVENQFRIGLVRMERIIREKMTLHAEINKAVPSELINSKPITAALREFFGSSQLSQFMDQTNPLAAITHKRRLSALGPGGISRDRAGFEVRDVHPSHYGRLCPIETPEGPNIGLISSLSCYAKVNEFGFIVTPYKKVENGKILDHVKITDIGDSNFKIHEVVLEEEVERVNEKLIKEGKEPASYEPYAFYLTAWEEENYVIAQSTVRKDENNNILDEHIDARYKGNFILARREDINFIDTSPQQPVSVAASLIPFLEHDDANRALMGSNMQRQAVPLLISEAPIVGTGMEGIAAKDSGVVVVCKRSGIVEKVDSQRIIVRVTGEELEDELEEAGVDVYKLNKFRRSNQDTCINQKPLVKEGDYVEKGQVIADGPCTDRGELALGKNVLVAFMPWDGYNYEDAILISQRLVKDDVYTSIHIKELEIEARDTKLGPEEITRDIPNVSNENLLKDLDESGIIRIGAYVKPGSILVGKVTPQGETKLTAEERLLKAIFGDKASEVKDNSLKCPPGIEGIVVDVKIFTRNGLPKSKRALEVEEDIIKRLKTELNDQIAILRDERDRKIRKLFRDKTLSKDVFVKKLDKTLTEGTKLTKEILDKFSSRELRQIKIKEDNEILILERRSIEEKLNNKIRVLQELFDEKVEGIRRGNELPAGVNQLVKVYIAMKRKISIGDKMSGRHGNKGVISNILPEEDMPFMEDGTPVDIVLNPLGVPSRMNIGQILETHLGLAGKVLGLHFKTPVFDGAKEHEIKELLKKAGFDTGGKVTLYDGRTGKPFEQKVTVGYMYMLKLSHLADDKLHARSIGPYSLITQQPLGGKAQFGGQRFGEMEVWALEAYGAANVLQEILTVKSDDVQGRNKIYHAIVKGEPSYLPGIPESFNVLIRELQSLCLDVELIKLRD